MKPPFVLDDKYEVLGKIGQGNFGKVYRAEDLRLGRNVAIKILSRDCPDPEFLSMFERESRSMATLNHPHVATVHDFGDCDHGPYMVMEFIEGVTLEALIAGGPLESGRARDLSIQIAEGMIHAHAHGFLHRDLKLMNIMVGRDGSAGEMVKILDFGLVKFLNSTHQTAGLSGMGTPSYMSPEQIANEDLDQRTDIFSFGICLFRLLHGRFPFESEHPAAIAFLILNETVITYGKHVPPPLRDLISRCLEKEKENRPASFVAVRDILRGMGELRAMRGELPAAVAGKVISRTREGRQNPFLNRVMIKSPHQFVGRAREVKRIYSRIDASHPQSVSIVGDRRIGKSSLLNFIYNRDNRREHMSTGDSALFAYLDFQRITDFTVPKFVRFLVSALELEAAEKLGQNMSWDLDGLREVVMRVHDNGRRIIILMDEFEVITSNQNFEEGFFSFLRSLANNYRLAFVTSSHEELQQMCHDRTISDSPFFNIFSNMPLRAFSNCEARDLIIGQSKREGVDLAEHVDRVVSMTGRLPFFLQMGGSALFEEMIDSGSRPLDWSRVETTFLEEATPHFESFWEHATGDEQINLELIAKGRPTDDRFAYVNESLMRRGFVDEFEGEFMIPSQAFAGFIRKKAGYASTSGRLSSFLAKFRR